MTELKPKQPDSRTGFYFLWWNCQMIIINSKIIYITQYMPHRPGLLFAVFWCFDTRSLANLRGTAPPRVSQCLEVVNNSLGGGLFKLKPTYPETTPSIRSFIKLSYSRLNSCPNQRGPGNRPLEQPLYSRVHWNHSDPKPACPDFLFPSCKNHSEGSGHRVPLSLYLLTNPGAPCVAPVVWCALISCELWVTNYLFNNHHLLICWTYHIPNFLLIHYILKQ